MNEILVRKSENVTFLSQNLNLFSTTFNNLESAPACSQNDHVRKCFCLIKQKTWRAAFIIHVDVVNVSAEFRWKMLAQRWINVMSLSGWLCQSCGHSHFMLLDG